MPDNENLAPEPPAHDHAKKDVHQDIPADCQKDRQQQESHRQNPPVQNDVGHVYRVHQAEDTGCQKADAQNLENVQHLSVEKPADEEHDNGKQKKHGNDSPAGKKLGPVVDQNDQEDRRPAIGHGPGKALGVVSSAENEMVGIELGGRKK